jgi:DNA polymerase IV
VRKILHIDADCFFASVEIRDNPSLIGKPIAVGGLPGRRGVIATCSYEARKFGVRSAMPSAHAMRLCPDLQILKPNFERYKAVSAGLMDILAEYASAIEPLSLDEAFLDVSSSEHCQNSATRLAQHIQQRVKNELGITVSAGAAPVKFLAKIASGWRKPHGLFVITPADVERFSATLAVQRLPGVGPVMTQKLQKYGLYQCSDIRKVGEGMMVQSFGKIGGQLFQRAWGIDERAVEESSARKSLSVEQTYATDLDGPQLFAELPALLERLSHRLEQCRSTYLAQKCFVKLKFDNFQQTTLEAPLPRCSESPSEDYFARLLSTAWSRARQPVRLLGVGVKLRDLRASRDAAWQQLALL